MDEGAEERRISQELRSRGMLNTVLTGGSLDDGVVARPASGLLQRRVSATFTSPSSASFRGDSRRASSDDRPPWRPATARVAGSSGQPLQPSPRDLAAVSSGGSPGPLGPASQLQQGGAAAAPLNSRAGSASTKSVPRRNASFQSVASFQSIRSVVEPEEAARLRSQVATLQDELAVVQDTIRTQADLEQQLRGTVDLLRARLHSQSQREIENQRRLAMFTRLEPLFDRLAERFTFRTPGEVVDRLEFLENDKLGTMDQLIRAQEEIIELQKQVEEAREAAERTRIRLTTDNVLNAARLQEQNEQLQAELAAVSHLNTKLEDRQGELVKLQTAVMELWSNVQRDEK